MKECFVPKAFSLDHRAVIRKANAIIVEYREMGFSLTLRQLYYQFVARDFIPNTQQSYKRLGGIVNDARLAGLIDWDAIEDRTRYLREFTTFVDPTAAIKDVVDRYIEDLWRDQECYFVVMIEKDALVGVIEPVCQRYRLPFFACRGYVSQSEQYLMGKRLERKLYAGKRPIVLHLGDHDPSGIDMTRDNRDRIRMFADTPEIEVRRLALNMAQIEEYSPPPNPAKETDSRHRDYVETYNTESSWELDALDPKVIDALIEDEVEGLLDRDLWDANVEKEAANRKRLADAGDRWGDIEKFLEK